MVPLQYDTNVEGPVLSIKHVLTGVLAPEPLGSKRSRRLESTFAPRRTTIRNLGPVDNSYVSMKGMKRPCTGTDQMDIVVLYSKVYSVMW